MSDQAGMSTPPNPEGMARPFRVEDLAEIILLGLKLTTPFNREVTPESHPLKTVENVAKFFDVEVGKIITFALKAHNVILTRYQIVPDHLIYHIIDRFWRADSPSSTETAPENEGITDDQARDLKETVDKAYESSPSERVDDWVKEGVSYKIGPNPEVTRIMQNFKYEGLDPMPADRLLIRLQFGQIAKWLSDLENLPHNTETMMALQRLLEAMNWALRAARAK